MISWLWIWVIVFTALTSISCTAQNAEGNPLSQAPISKTGSLEVVPTKDETRLPLNPTATGVDPVVTAIQSPMPAVNLEPTKQKINAKANADVLFVKARQASEDTWHFTVTVKHPDAGWEDYADGWDVVLPDGSVVKPDSESPFTRLLLHPHETEQPFTRSQGGIVILPEITVVTVRAHDLVDGFGGREVVVDLMTDGGTDYEVQRLEE